MEHGALHAEAALDVKYVDLQLQNESIEADLLDAVRDVIRSGQAILGDPVAQFEKALADLHQLAWAIGVKSGTDALCLALRAVGVGPGDEVITVPNSFVATVAAIVHVGANPVLVDVDEAMTMDPDALEGAITPRTRAVIPVHLHGRPARMDEIVRIVKRHDLAIIEDCAQAIGARLRDRLVGTFGVAGCYSMHPLKNLGALGDAGAIVGSGADLRDRLRLLRNHGLRTRDECDVWGFNARLDTIQAAMLLVKLRHLANWTMARRAIAARYLAALSDLPLVLPHERPGEFCVWHGFVVQTDERDALRSFLRRQGVEALIYYPIPIHRQRAARELGYACGRFPNCERQAERILSLPVRHDLTAEQVDRVVSAVREFFCGRG